MPLTFAVTDEPIKAEPEPGQKKRGRPPGSSTGARVETQVRDELTMFLKLASAMWSTKDPVCGPILNRQSELIAADIAKYAAKQRWARKYIEKVADFGELIPFLIHIQPVIMAIYAHHLAPPPEPEQETDNVVTGPWPPNGA